MPMKKRILLFFAISLSTYTCSPPLQKNEIADCKSPKFEKMSGLSFVSPPRPFGAEAPMPAIVEMNAKWLCISPYAMTRKGEAAVHYGSRQQWWGERRDGVLETVVRAHRAGLKVMMKPQVWGWDLWTGDMDYDHETDWKKWEKDYEQYILPLATLADSLGVAIFCVGTEYKIATRKRPAFWRALIQKVRKVYRGKLAYAANWDNYENIPFWADLDIIGINAYFPLSQAKTPTVAALKQAWHPIKKKMKRLYCQYKKPIAFTEFGYLSLDGCAYNTWELENKRKETPINEQAQANCFEALFEVFSKENWWAGGFIWKWYPRNASSNAYHRSGQAWFRKGDYTPQGKLSATVIQKWYAKFEQ